MSQQQRPMPESENGYLKSQVSSPRMCGIHLEFRHIAEEELQSFKFTIELQDKNGFDALEQEVKQKLQREGKTSDQHRLYIRHGLYSVGYANGFVLETCCLDKADDWTSCMAMRKKVDDLKPGQAVKIAIHIEYSAIPSFCRTQSGPSAREFCDDLIHKKLLKSNRDENYLPHVDLSAIVASNNIVRLIINDEAPRDWEDARRDQLDRTVLEEGRQMFATCVRANEPIVHLEEILVKEKINDLAMQRRDEEDIILGDSAKLNRLYEAHWLFYPLHFGEDERGKYLHGHNESVHKFKRLPIAVGKNLGRGASGEVRAARIEGSQHRCHTYRNKDMALKIFNNDRGWEYFKREVDMLSEVAKRPHPHIVPYLFAWKQRDKGFILFELAQYDLRFFLMENKKPKASMKFCIWFLEQIYGIADAINTVHNRGPSKTYGNTLNPDTRINRHGYFHDLKPENILVYFENNSFMNGSIKISDLGAGRMHEVVGVTDGVMDGVIDEVMARSIQSVQSTRGNRTETYESPQAYDNTGQRKFGRAEDMWAFGCVIFELLQWAFTEPSQTRRTLKSELHGPVDSETCHQFPAFYQMNTQPNGCKVAVLRPKVLEWMMVIEEGCKDEFRDVLDLVRRLLEPVEKDRLKSHELNEKLKEVLKSAKLTLEANPNHYADNITTPPSESLRVPGQSANVEGKSLSKSSTIHEEEESESETSESQEEVEVLHAAGTIPRITVG